MVAGIGDFNGDGFDDFLVTQPYGRTYGTTPYGYQGTLGTGAAYVVFGGPDGPATLDLDTLDGSNGFKLISGFSRDGVFNSSYSGRFTNLGQTAAALGDVDGDGLTDFIIAQSTYFSPRYDYNTGYGGQVTPNFIYIVFGASDPEPALQRIDELQGGPRVVTVAGLSGRIAQVKSAGDANGDGFADILLTQRPPYSYGYYGEVGAFYGGYGYGERPTIGYVLFGGDALGAESHTDGVLDVRGLDGANGFAIRGFEPFQPFTGGYYGGPDGDTYYSRENLSFRVSTSVDSEIVALGDIDGDGLTDFFVRIAQTERVRVYDYVPAELRTFDPTPDAPNSGDEFEYTYGGYDRYQYSYSVGAKRAFLLFGKDVQDTGGVVELDRYDYESYSVSPADRVDWPGARSDYYSYSYLGARYTVAGIGDINGDGYDDVALAAEYTFLLSGEETFVSGRGVVYVLFGGPDGPARSVGGFPGGGADLILTTNPFDGPDVTVERIGQNIVGVGDVNGDGVDDFVVTAYGLSGVGVYERNAAFLVFGVEGLASGSIVNVEAEVAAGRAYRFEGANFFNTPSADGSQNRQWLAPAGDINGDGFADIIVGAPYDRTGAGPDSYFGYANGGRAFVIYGGPDALESADNADGANDNVINLDNLIVDVVTGLLPIDVSLRDAGGVGQSRAEGRPGEGAVFSFIVQRTGDLGQPVSFDFAVAGSGANPATADDFAGGAFPSGTIAFAAGSATARIEVAIAGDRVIEPDEEFSVTISNVSIPEGFEGGLTGGDTTFGRIVNDDFPARLQVFNASTTEGQDLTFLIRRSGDLDSEVTVKYVIQSGAFSPAVSADILGGLPVFGEVTFAPGETTVPVSVGTVDDLMIEGTERVEILLFDPSSPEPIITFDVQATPATGFIFDNDFPVTLGVFGNFPLEGSGTPLTFTFTRSGDTQSRVEVFYEFRPAAFNSVDADDFVDGFPPNGSVVFEAGETTKTVALAILDDQIQEPNERLDVFLIRAEAPDALAVQFSNTQAFGQIQNDDFNIEFSVGNVSGFEDAGAITVTVFRTGRTNVAAEVDYEVVTAAFLGATQDDVVQTLPITGTLSFAAGQTSRTFQITPVADTIVEPNERLEVRLTEGRTDSGVPIVLQTTPGVVTILNDDFNVDITARSESRFEDDGQLRFFIERSGRTNVEVTVDYVIEHNTTDAADIAQTLPLVGSVTFAPGQTQRIVTINPVADNIIEPNEFVQMTLSNGRLSGASAGVAVDVLTQAFPAFGQILNDDFPVQLSVGSASVTEGGTLTFNVFRSGETDVAVDVAWRLETAPSRSAGAADLTGGLPQAGMVSFAAGQTVRTVSFPTVNDTIVEGDEFVRFVIAGATTSDPDLPITGVGAVATGTIIDNDFNIVIRANGASALEASGALVFTIVRSGELGAPVTVDYRIDLPPAGFAAASSTDVVGGLPQTGSVSFGANETVKLVVLGIIDDLIVEPNEAVALTLTGASTISDRVVVLQSAPAIGTILNDDFNIDLRVSAQSATEGGNLIFTVTRTGETAAAVDVVYTLQGSGASPADADDLVGGLPQGGVITLAPFQTAATLVVPTAQDDIEEPNEGVSLTIVSASSSSPRLITGVGATAQALIINDDLPVQFRVSGAAGFEDDGPLNFVVTRSGNLAVGATVEYRFTPYPFGNAATSDDVVGGLPQFGVAQFLPNQTTAVISITPVADTIIEPTEILQLDLLSATADGGTRTEFLGSRAFGYIYNDDFAPRITVTGGGTVFEGNSGFTPVLFTFERVGSLNDVVTVRYNLEQVGLFPADSNDIEGFLPGFGLTVTFAPDQTTAFAVVNINGDGIIEQNETFALRVTEIVSTTGVNYELSGGFRVVTILNDDGRPPVIPPFFPFFPVVFGDPHIVTLDNLTYSFMAVGEFVLIESVPGAENPFQVQARFEPAPGSSLVSVTTRMAVAVAGHVVEIAAGAPNLLIDGVVTEIDPDLGAIDLDGDGEPDVYRVVENGLVSFVVVLNETLEQLRVDLQPGYLNFSLALGPDRAAAVRGLMGDGDGVTENDIALRDGTIIAQPAPFATLYGDYADSWRVDPTGADSDKASLFSYAEGQGTADFTDPTFPAGVVDLSQVPADLLAAAEAAADAAGIVDPVLREAAILDFVFTGDPSFLTGAAGLPTTDTTGLEIEDAPVIPTTVNVAATVASVVEGDAGVQDVVFRIFRTGPTDAAISVDYVIEGDVDADDLAPGTALSGSVLIEADQSEATLTIGVAGDLMTEPDERLVVRIVAASDGVVGAATAQTVILTDDFPPIAEDDEFSVAVGGILEDSLFGANGTAEGDRDPDGDPIEVVAVDGQAIVGDSMTIELLFGALTVRRDGGVVYETGPGAAAIAAGAIGFERFAYRISDGRGGFDDAMVAIAVQAPAAAANRPPTFAPSVAQAVENGPAVTVDLAALAVDPDGDDLSFAITQDPALGGVSLVGATLSFDPNGGGIDALNAGETIEVVIGLQVTDGVFFTPSMVTVTITGVNDAPTLAAFDIDLDLFEDSPPATLDLRGQGDDADAEDDGTTLTYALVGEPPVAGSVSIEGGILTFDPGDDFQHLKRDEVAVVAVDVQATDSRGAVSEVRTLTVTVTGVNSAPVAVADTATTTEDAAVVINVLSNDEDADFDPLGIESFDVSQTKGLVALNDDGTFTYDPNGAFDALNDGEVAVDSFVYTVTDGFESSSATVTIEIRGVSDVVEGPNVVIGAPNQPRLEGTDGDDVLVFGASRSSQAFGGDGADIFVFGQTAGDGRRDVAYIRDFEQGRDLIDLSGQAFSLRATSRDSVITLDTPDRDTLFVTGVSLTEADFTDAWTNRDPGLLA